MKMKRNVLIAALLICVIVAVIIATSAFSFKSALPFIGGIIVQKSATMCSESDNGVFFYAKGTISGGQRVAGLVGDLNGGTLKRSYSTSDVVGTSLAGGLVGRQTGAYVFLNSFYDQTNVTITASSFNTIGATANSNLISQSLSFYTI